MATKVAVKILKTSPIAILAFVKHLSKSFSGLDYAASLLMLLEKHYSDKCGEIQTFPYLAYLGEAHVHVQQ